MNIHKSWIRFFGIYFLLEALVCLGCSSGGKGENGDDPEPLVPDLPVSENFYVSAGGFTLAIPKANLNQLDRSIEDQLKAELAFIDSILPDGVGGRLKNDTIIVENVMEHCRQVKTNQPQLLLNLFARHLYGELLAEDEKAIVTTAYRKAIAGKYERVYYSNGRKLEQNRIPDAGKDALAYFAELTEAYWGENDYYPFDYAELERYDPDGFQAMQEIWGERAVAAHPHGITLPPATLKQWLAGEESPLDSYYRKYLDAGGLAILSSRFVADEALLQARDIVNAMLSRIPEALEKMLESHFRIGIIGADEDVTDLPENRMMPVWWPETDWNARGRGYGATEAIPLMSCGEENLIRIAGYTERYPYESIMVHEFAHNVDYGLRKGRPGFGERLVAAYGQAKAKGLWAGTYAMENDSEYFAEGVQAWFNTCNMYVEINGVTTKLKTRQQLEEYDPVLYGLLGEIMPEAGLEGYHFTFE